jgi:hypothetical protein
MPRRSRAKKVLVNCFIGLSVILLTDACGPVSSENAHLQQQVQLLKLRGEIQRLVARIDSLEVALRMEQSSAARAQQQTQEQRLRIVALENEPQMRAVRASTTPTPPNVEHETLGAIPPDAREHRPQSNLRSANSAAQAEAELVLAYRALTRAIERLDISAEEKAALKNSLRPTRSLDHNNPWSVADY